MKAAIVGGGVGGLTTALLLSQSGWQVTLYEGADQLGGRLKYVEREGFKVDQGPTIVLLPELLLSVLEEGGISRDRINLERLDPLYRLTFRDGTELWKRQRAEDQVEELERVFPGEGQGFIRYQAEMKTRFQVGRKAFLERSFQKRRDFWTVRNIKHLTRLKAWRSVATDAATFFQDPRVRTAFSLQSLYIGGNPYQSPALYSLVPYSEHDHGVWYLKGGYAGLVAIMEEELRGRGVDIRLGTKVAQVWVEDGSCTGVQIGGQKVPYDKVIVNGDFPGTWKLVTDSRLKPPRKTYQASSGCFLLYIGLDRIYQDQPVHQFLLSADFKGMLDQVFGERTIPEDPSIYIFNPSTVDSSLAPGGKSVLYVLVPVGSGYGVDWEQQQELLEQQVLNRLEAGPFPGLRQSILWKERRTPQTAWEEGLFEGGSFGLAPILGQSGVFRPQHTPYGVEGLHAVGASTHPGGGVPIVMLGAKLLAEELTKG